MIHQRCGCDVVSRRKLLLMHSVIRNSICNTEGDEDANGTPLQWILRDDFHTHFAPSSAMHLKVGPIRLSTDLRGSGCYVIVWICLNECCQPHSDITVPSRLCQAADQRPDEDLRKSEEEVRHVHQHCERKVWFFWFFFGWMCLVCKAYLALLSFAKKMRFSWDAGLSLSEESGRWISARGWVEKVLITSMDRCPSTTCKNAAKSDLSMDCWPSTTSKIAATCCHTLTCKNVAKHGLPMDRWPSTTPRNLAKPSVCLAKMLQNAACRCGVGRRQLQKTTLAKPSVWLAKMLQKVVCRWTVAHRQLAWMLQTQLSKDHCSSITPKNAAAPSVTSKHVAKPCLSMDRWPSTIARNLAKSSMTCKNDAKRSLSMGRWTSTHQDPEWPWRWLRPWKMRELLWKYCFLRRAPPSLSSPSFSTVLIFLQISLNSATLALLSFHSCNGVLWPFLWGESWLWTYWSENQQQQQKQRAII